MVARLLLLPLIVVAAAILVKGFTSVGDGFAAGMVAALAVLLQYLALGVEEAERSLPLHRAPVLGATGLLLALAVAIAPLAAGEPILTHAPAPGKSPVKLGTLELATATAFDLAICLLVIGVVVSIIRVLVHPPEEDRA